MKTHALITDYEGAIIGHTKTELAHGLCVKRSGGCGCGKVMRSDTHLKNNKFMKTIPFIETESAHEK